MKYFFYFFLFVLGFCFSHEKSIDIRKCKNIKKITSVDKFHSLSSINYFPDKFEYPFLLGYPKDIPLNLLKNRNALGPHCFEKFIGKNPWLNIPYTRVPYVAIFNDCYIDVCSDGLIFTPQQKLLLRINKWDVYSDFRIQKPVRNLIHLPKAVHLLQKCSEGYYHFLIEVVPRLALILDLLDKDPDLKILLSPPRQPFMDEIFKILQIPMDSVVYCDNSTIYHVDELIFPRPSYMGYPSIQEIQTIRKLLLDPVLQKEKQQQENLIIIIERLGSSRHVKNTQEIVKYVKKRYADFKIVVFDGNLTVPEQIKLFNRAKLIIGPHGAGFTNIIFSNPNATCIEFVPEYFLSILYWHISQAMQHDHHHIIINNAHKDSQFNVPLKEIQNKISLVKHLTIN